MEAFETREIKRGNIRYVVELVHDSDGGCRCDWIGKYSDEWRPGAIDTAMWYQWGHGYNNKPIWAPTWDRQTFRWFIPACDPEEVREIAQYYSRKGMSHHEAWLKASRVPRSQYEMMRMLGESWWFIGIVVTAYVGDAKVASASLFGVEDGEIPGADPSYKLSVYHDEIIEELIGECRTQLVDAAERLG